MLLMWRHRKPKLPGTRVRLGAFFDECAEFEGKFACAGTVVMDAKFCGEIMSKDTLIIGERAIVRANVRTGILVVRGELVGNVTASESVELKSGARVTGDVEAPVIIIEKGAVIDGNCRMTQVAVVEAHLAVVVPMTG